MKTRKHENTKTLKHENSACFNVLMFSCFNEKGLTLIELLVSISIVAIISGIFLTNYHSANRKSEVVNTGYKAVSDIRLIQQYSLGAKNFSGSAPQGGWGIRFNESAGNYIIFADVDGQYDYDVSEKFKEINLPSGVTISSIDIGSYADIVFLPPNPITYINGNSAGNAEIEFSDGTSSSTIQVNFAGLVEVQ